jgi:hypothetical protein
MKPTCVLTRSFLCALALVTCLLPASSLCAQDSKDALDPNNATERARVHFHNGVDFYHENNFRAALIEFRRAYKAAPHYKLLYNLGQVSLELQEDGPAIDYFTDYLSEGADELSPERKLEVQDKLVRLQARLAHAVITTDQGGAEIYVDDGLVGNSPLSTSVRLSVGRRRITAKKRGFITAERTLDVAAGDNMVIALELREVTSDLGKLQVASIAHADNALSAAAWGGIATAVFGVSAVTLTVLTGVAQANFDSERKRQTSEPKLQDLRDDTKHKALGADIAWGATIAAAGVTTVLLLASSGSERTPAEDHKQVNVELGVGSLQLRGSF